MPDHRESAHPKSLTINALHLFILMLLHLISRCLIFLIVMQSSPLPKRKRTKKVPGSPHAAKGRSNPNMRRNPVGKATFTERRWNIRQLTWEPVKQLIRRYLESAPQGAAMRMAEAIGCQPSQIHRFTCPICEHDQESMFSTAFAMIAYIGYQRSNPIIDIPKDSITILPISRN